MTREIPLTRGMVALVDDEDYERVVAYRWHASESARGYWYARRDVGTRKIRRRVYLHAFIAEPPPGFNVDHINGNRLDDRRANLRVATQSQNMGNQGARRSAYTGQTARSGFKGVAWHDHCGRWRARIKVGKRAIALGLFDSEVDAARAYDAAAREHFGEFARTNFET